MFIVIGIVVLPKVTHSLHDFFIRIRSIVLLQKIILSLHNAFIGGVLYNGLINSFGFLLLTSYFTSVIFPAYSPAA